MLGAQDRDRKQSRHDRNLAALRLDFSRISVASMSHDCFLRIAWLCTARFAWHLLYTSADEPTPQRSRAVDTYQIYVIQGQTERDWSDCHAAPAHVPARVTAHRSGRPQRPARRASRCIRGRTFPGVRRCSTAPRLPWKSLRTLGAAWCRLALEPRRDDGTPAIDRSTNSDHDDREHPEAPHDSADRHNPSPSRLATVRGYDRCTNHRPTAVRQMPLGQVGTDR
jgi:hypothetical protein